MKRKIDELFLSMGITRPTEEVSEEQIEMMKTMFEETLDDEAIEKSTNYFNLVGTDFLNTDFLESTKNMNDPIFAVQQRVLKGIQSFYFILKEKDADITGDELRIPLLGDTLEDLLSYCISSHRLNLKEGYDVPILFAKRINNETETVSTMYIDKSFLIELEFSNGDFSTHRFDSYDEASDFGDAH